MSVESSPTEGGNLARNSFREGDHGLGIPQSRVEGARVLSEEEIAEDQREDQHRRDEERQRQSEERSLQLDTAKETFRSSKGGNLTREPLHEGDHGLGIPQSRVEGARVLSEEEIAEDQQEDQRRRNEERQFEERRRQRDAAGDSFRLPKSIIRVATWIGWTVASVLGLLLVGQGVALVGDIKSLPAPYDWIAGVSATFFAAMLGWLILRLGVALFRLRLSPAIKLRGLQALEQRKRWRHLVSQRHDAVKRELGKYLDEYKVDGDAGKRLSVPGRVQL